MYIRHAKEADIEYIDKLLYQVNMVHSNGRPDLFVAGGRKYTTDELVGLINDEQRPIFVAVNEDTEEVMGYAFCIFQNHQSDTNMTDIITLYIDDLCVDENCRGQKIGYRLYEHVLAFAKEQGCYNVTLNVWSCNESAMKFYEKCGLKQQKIGMEHIL